MQGSDPNCCHWRVLQVEKHLKADIRLSGARIQTKRGGFRLEAPSRSTRLGRIAQVLANPALSPNLTSEPAPPLSTAQHIMFPPLAGGTAYRAHAFIRCILYRMPSSAAGRSQSRPRAPRYASERPPRCSARAGAASSRLRSDGVGRRVGPRRASGAATSSVHETRLKQRPPAAVSCVERRAHVHGWSSDSAVVHEERERCLDSSCADEVHALGACSHRRHTGRSGLV